MYEYTVAEKDRLLENQDALFEQLGDLSELQLREIRKHILYKLNKIDLVIYQAIRRLKDDGIPEDPHSFEAARSRKAALLESKRLINEQLRILDIKDTPRSEAKIFMRVAQATLPAETYALIGDAVKSAMKKVDQK